MWKDILIASLPVVLSLTGSTLLAKNEIKKLKLQQEIDLQKVEKQSKHELERIEKEIKLQTEQYMKNKSADMIYDVAGKVFTSDAFVKEIANQVNIKSQKTVNHPATKRRKK